MSNSTLTVKTRLVNIVDALADKCSSHLDSEDLKLNLQCLEIAIRSLKNYTTTQVDTPDDEEILSRRLNN